jgi:large repetitive protein
MLNINNLKLRRNHSMVRQLIISLMISALIALPMGLPGVTSASNAMPVFTVPNTPIALQLGGMGVYEDQLALGFYWVDNSSDETGFRIEKKQGVGGTYSVVATVGANTDNLGGIYIPRDGSTYLFRVKAYNGSGESLPTNEVAIDTDLAEQVPPPMPNTPSAFNIGGVSVTSTQYALSFYWTDTSSDEVGFRLEQKQGSGGTYFVVATVGANTNNVGGILLPKNGSTYYFRVKSYNANGESASSNEVSFTATP